MASRTRERLRQFRNVVLRLDGSEFWCPTCERGARRFLAEGQPRRPAARCPWCGSLERHRLLVRYLETLPAPASVLHVAPERHIARRLKATGARYLSVDLAAAADVTADITLPLPFAEGEFDLIVCSHVLEHVSDDAAAIRQLARVLSPGGHLLVMVPVADADQTDEEPVEDADERLRRYGQSDHVRMYGRDVIDRLRRGGLTVERFAWDALSEADVAQIGIDSAAGDIYVCSAPAIRSA